MASFCVKIYKNKEDRWQMWPKLTEKSELKSANTKLSFVVGLTNELNMVGLNTDSKSKKKKRKRKRKEKIWQKFGLFRFAVLYFFLQSSKEEISGCLIYCNRNSVGLPNQNRKV